MESKNGRMFAFAGLLVIAVTTITSAARATAFITFTDDFSPQASALWSNSIGNWTSASGKYFAHAITLEGLIEKASQILDLAMAEKQFSAAVAALQELGTLAGLRIERREVGRPGEFELLNAHLRH